MHFLSLPKQKSEILSQKFYSPRTLEFFFKSNLVGKKTCNFEKVDIFEILKRSSQSRKDFEMLSEVYFSLNPRSTQIARNQQFHINAHWRKIEKLLTSVIIHFKVIEESSEIIQVHDIIMQSHSCIFSSLIKAADNFNYSQSILTSGVTFLFDSRINKSSGTLQ